MHYQHSPMLKSRMEKDLTDAMYDASWNANGKDELIKSMSAVMNAYPNSKCFWYAIIGDDAWFIPSSLDNLGTASKDQIEFYEKKDIYQWLDNIQKEY